MKILFDFFAIVLKRCTLINAKMISSSVLNEISEADTKDAVAYVYTMVCHILGHCSGFHLGYPNCYCIGIKNHFPTL